MRTESYPIQPTTPAPTVPAQEPALHLRGGIWIASCPSCGYQLTTARTQERCERRASRRTCRICREDPDARCHHPRRRLCEQATAMAQEYDTDPDAWNKRERAERDSTADLAC